MLHREREKMTTIKELKGIVEYTRSLNSRDEKLSYLNCQARDILNFLSGNIKKDGIAKTIASEISISDKSINNMENIIEIFSTASTISSKKIKIKMMKEIRLNKEDREFILTVLYGSLKLGVTIPTPEPNFGDIIKPQLCGTGIEFDPKKYIIEEKFDGIRCIATNNNGKIILQSRNGKNLNVPIIKNSLANAIQSGITIDGEIVAADGQFESLDRNSNNLVYRIFDIIFTEEIKIQMPLYHRLIILDHEIYENDHVQISPELKLNSMDEINKWINKTGAEGIIAKNPNSFYIYRDRKEWIKYKLFKECTAKVIGFTHGTGKRNRNDMIGAILVVPENSNVVSKVGSGFTDSDLIKMRKHLDNKDDILVNVKYQNLTNDGCLRFGIFLNIKSINGKERLD
jgi:hypothetical protein